MMTATTQTNVSQKECTAGATHNALMNHADSTCDLMTLNIITKLYTDLRRLQLKKPSTVIAVNPNVYHFLGNRNIQKDLAMIAFKIGLKANRYEHHTVDFFCPPITNKFNLNISSIKM